MKMESNYRIEKVQNSNEPMGVEYVDGKLTFRVPETFHIYDNESLNRQNLLLFLKSLNLSDSFHSPEIWKSDLKGESWPIDSYLWIIRDYLENGYYYNREKKYYRSAQGKIEWKKTLKQMPIVSNSNVIYNNLVTSKVSASNDLIAQIYRLCLKVSHERIGWIFGYCLFVELSITKSLAEMKHAIAGELNSTFDDVKRIRFKHMIHILDSIDERDILSTNATLLVRNYYHVFERMIDQLFGGLNDRQRRKYNPNGKWNLIGNRLKDSSALEPDTILKYNGNTIIIDAKMYRFGFTGDENDLPDSPSIQKQLTYGDHAKTNIENGNEVRNTFILPFDKLSHPLKEWQYESLEEENIVYIGYAEGDWREQEKPNDHDRIYTYLIDFNYVLNNYNVNESKATCFLCSDIEKRISRNKSDYQ